MKSWVNSGSSHSSEFRVFSKTRSASPSDSPFTASSSRSVSTPVASTTRTGPTSVSRGSAVDEVQRPVDVRPAVDAEVEAAHVRVGAVGDRFVPREGDARVPAVDVHPGPNRDGDVVDDPAAPVRLDRLDLLEAPAIALPAVGRSCQEGPRELPRELAADDLGAEAEHVHVVVLDTLVRGIDVVADRGADPVELAGRDRGADAQAADEDAAVRGTGGERVRDVRGLVGIVDARRRRVGPEVDDLVTERLDLREQALPQGDAAVVERNRDSHQDAAAAFSA